jgi:hypothetical protein
MKNSAILLVILFFGALNANAQDRSEETLVSKNNFYYQMPTLKLDTNCISRSFIAHPKMYLGVLGYGVIGIKGGKYIVLFDINNGKLLSEFSLDPIFYGSKNEKSKKPYFTGFSVNGDTAIFMLPEQILIATIHPTGLKLIQKIVINKKSASEWYKDWTLDATYSFEPLLINNKINLCRMSCNISTSDPTFYEQPHTLEFFLNSEPASGLTLPISFGQNYKSGFHGSLFQPQRVYNSTSNEFVYGYQSSTEMQCFNPSKGSTRILQVKSNYQTADIPYVEIGKEKGYQDLYTTIIQNDQYTHLIYDPFHNGYYRFFRKGLGNIPITDFNLIFSRPLVVMILDSALNIIDEIMFPEPNYIEQNSFAGPEGLYLSFHNWNGGARKSGSYDILKWPLNKQNESEFNSLIPVIIGNELSFPKNNLSDGPYIITIHDSVGKLILRSDYNSNTFQLPELSAGTYFGYLSNRTWSGSFKFIKN